MPVPANTRRINIEAGLLGGEQMVHTFHCRATDPSGFVGGNPTLQQQADFVRTAWNTSFMTWAPNAWGPKVSTTTVYTRVVVYQLTAAGGVEDSAEALFSPGLAGTGVGLMPSSSAIVASMKTGKPGRSFRGRSYLGGLAPNTLETTTGRVSTATTALLAASMANFLTTLNGEGADAGGEPAIEMGVLSRTRTLLTPIIAVIVDNVFDQQSRRNDSLIPAKSQALVTNLG